MSADRPEPRYSVLGDTPRRPVEADALDPADLTGCQFGCLALFAPVWLAIAAGPFLWAVWQRGELPPFGVATAIPYLFAVFGIWLVAASARAGCLWLADELVGRLRVVVTPSPMWAGGQHEVRVTPWTSSPLRAVRVTLLYRHRTVVQDSEGSSTVYRGLTTFPVGVADALPWAGGFALPADAPASGAVAATGVEWRVRLAGRLFGWWPVTRDYEIRVESGCAALPGPADGATEEVVP